MFNHEVVKMTTEYSILPLHLLAVCHYLELAVALSVVVFATYAASALKQRRQEA